MMAKEYIEREAAIKAVCDCMPHTCSLDDCSHGCQGVAALDSVPAADVVPVVLCEDCKYCVKEDDFEYWCNGLCSPACLVRHDDFCSHGKRKNSVSFLKFQSWPTYGRVNENEEMSKVSEMEMAYGEYLND